MGMLKDCLTIYTPAPGAKHNMLITWADSPTRFVVLSALYTLPMLVAHGLKTMLTCTFRRKGGLQGTLTGKGIKVCESLVEYPLYNLAFSRLVELVCFPSSCSIIPPWHNIRQ